MKLSAIRRRAGFTLIELSLALGIGITTSALLLTLVNQQLAFLQIFRAQNFLTEEAPVISMFVSRIVGKAERFRLHANLADALSGANPRLTASPVMVMNFRQPDGTMRATILSFENRGNGNALYYYVVPVVGVLGAPQWWVSNKASNVSFFLQPANGVLQMQIDGPNQDRITYSGTMQQ